MLFALNEEYCLNEKKAVKMIDRFALRPSDYKHKVDAVFAAAGTDMPLSVTLLQEFIGEVAKLTGNQFD